MRRVVKPLEALLTSHKRIVIKDSAVSNKVILLLLIVYDILAISNLILVHVCGDVTINSVC